MHSCAGVHATSFAHESLRRETRKREGKREVNGRRGERGGLQSVIVGEKVQHAALKCGKGRGVGREGLLDLDLCESRAPERFHVARLELQVDAWHAVTQQSETYTYSHQYNPTPRGFRRWSVGRRGGAV